MSERVIPKVGDWFHWETIRGDKFEGIVVEMDSNVAYVKCTDGKTRPVEC